MENINENTLIISIIVSFVVGFGVCWIANMKDDYFENLMSSDDDFQDRVG